MRNNTSVIQGFNPNLAGGFQLLTTQFLDIITGRKDDGAWHFILLLDLFQGGEKLHNRVVDVVVTRLDLIVLTTSY
jgi:hypothetical protein